MTDRELIQKRNKLSQQYRECMDAITEMQKEIVKLQYHINEFKDKMCELDRDIMAIDMCL